MWQEDRAMELVIKTYFATLFSFSSSRGMELVLNIVPFKVTYSISISLLESYFEEEVRHVLFQMQPMRHKGLMSIIFIQ